MIMRSQNKIIFDISEIFALLQNWGVVQTSLKGYSTVTLFALFSEEDLFTIIFYQSYAMFVRTHT